MSAGDNAPVESMILGSSGMNGSFTAEEPTAMIALSKVSAWSPTVSEFGPVKRASP